ncbi:hypothetical protein [Streptomyces sp. NPDC058632]|uniref:hypothetical protein n=1 Tax=unclassified Streptomyces TaxID=2593676 RepID=UPI00365B193F
MPLAPCPQQLFDVGDVERSHLDEPGSAPGQSCLEPGDRGVTAFRDRAHHHERGLTWHVRVGRQRLQVLGRRALDVVDEAQHGLHVPGGARFGP